MLLINAAAVPPFPALEVSMPKPIPGDARCLILVEVSFERCVEVEFGDYRLIGFGFAQANEAAAYMEVAAFIWKIDLLLLTEKQTNEIRTVRN
jgi:hypothetical protein